MTEDRGEMKIRFTLKQGERGALSGKTVNSYPVSRWKIYKILVPAFIAVAFLSAFFFYIFFPLFLFGGITVGFWIWWLRRELRKSMRAGTLEGEYVVIKETHIVETETDKVEDQ
jgi:hypothetical protein